LKIYQMTSQFVVPNDFMGGIYLVEFATREKAEAFVARFAHCPVWPVITRATRDTQVLIIALELKCQQHGDFSQQGNTLAHHPEFLGASQVQFRRDDSLLELFPGHGLDTGYADVIPCGSNCEECASFKNPCQGCPAFYRYEV
jgi:hypothetical protein